MKPMLILYRRLVSLFYGKLANASAWMLVGSVLAGALGYALQLLMGRLLTVQDYALFSAVMALFTILATPLSTMVMVISRRVSYYRAHLDFGGIAYSYYDILKRSFSIGLVLLLIGLPFAPVIQEYLRAQSIVPVYLLGVLLYFTCFPFINNAFLQGLQKFTWLSLSNALNAILKIVLSTLLVWAGYGASGAIGGAALAYIATWIITLFIMQKLLERSGTRPTSNVPDVTFASVVPVLIANGAFAVVTQLDMVLVNYFFAPDEAGLFAAASILGKAVLYLPGGIALALFPFVAEHHAREEESAHLLIQALGMTFVMCVAGSTIYFFWGEWIVRLMYGDRYHGAGELLKYYGFAILPMALVMVVEYFLIAKGRVLFAYLLMGVVPLQVLAVYHYHDTLFTIIAITAITGVIIALIGFLMLQQTFKKSIR